MIPSWILELSNADLSMALDACYDSAVRKDLQACQKADLLFAVYDREAMAMVEHIIDCEFDRTWAQLSWNAKS